MINPVRTAGAVGIVMVFSWTDHILSRTLLLAVEADLPKMSKGGNFPTRFSIINFESDE
jgi:hypothetical protein